VRKTAYQETCIQPALHTAIGGVIVKMNTFHFTIKNLHTLNLLIAYGRSKSNENLFNFSLLRSGSE
jgi:hypothetical protein